jgi:predicted pyridoxine 5'-phosphate oxidase superfamily flavin-nucleotide-binding protein
MSPVNASPFNPDELAAQVLAGGGPRGNGIRDFMPEQHRHFLAQLPYLFVGAIDAAGWPLATLLTGHPGFVQSPDAVTLRIDALPDIGDPAADSLAPSRDIGILGIDLSTRRRIRANGRIISREAEGIRGDTCITIAVSQSFGNCPQYIQRRIVAASRVARADAAAISAESFAHLDEAGRSAIASADTFFVASRSRCGDGAAFGADISHRGGRPGFVRIDGDVLTIPDFRGNRYFNTLGNLTAEPRASLLFVDFETGDLLQLQGRTEVEWNGSAAEQIAGAERLWRFHIACGWRRAAASPLRWSFVDYSRTAAATGLWH